MLKLLKKVFIKFLIILQSLKKKKLNKMIDTQGNKKGPTGSEIHKHLEEEEYKA